MNSNISTILKELKDMDIDTLSAKERKKCLNLIPKSVKEQISAQVKQLSDDLVQFEISDKEKLTEIEQIAQSWDNRRTLTIASKKTQFNIDRQDNNWKLALFQNEDNVKELCKLNTTMDDKDFNTQLKLCRKELTEQYELLQNFLEVPYSEKDRNKRQWGYE